jgi:hypothetical protein
MPIIITRYTMKKRPISALGSLFLATVMVAESAPQPLYPDAQSFAGMRQLGGKARYEIKDGVITGTSTLDTPNSFMATEKEYGDFELEYEFKVHSLLNSGVQIRSQSRADFNNGRVHGYQIEIDPSSRGWTGGLFEEAKRGWLQNMENQPETRAAFKADDWNHIKVRAVGAHLQTWLNGMPATDTFDAQTQKGFIALQVHNIKQPEQNGTQVQWRDLKITDLGEHTWAPLFDGKTLNGWIASGGGAWSVVEGAISGTSAANEARYGLLVSEKEYGDFTIKAVFRVTQGNSGFYLRGQTGESEGGITGLQAEICADDETGGLYESGGRQWVAQTDKKLMTEKKVYRSGDWNELWVSASGPRVVVHINGTKTADFIDPQPMRLQGKFALQLHGGQDMKVEFRSIEQLVPKKAN